MVHYQYIVIQCVLCSNDSFHKKILAWLVTFVSDYVRSEQQRNQTKEVTVISSVLYIQRVFNKFVAYQKPIFYTDMIWHVCRLIKLMNIPKKVEAITISCSSVTYNCQITMIRIFASTLGHKLSEHPRIESVGNQKFSFN